MYGGLDGGGGGSEIVSVMDPSERKMVVGHKLAQEEESLKALEERMQQSAHLTSGMTSILSSFEDRLSKLEWTILPVYQETENLQRRQDNIDRTLKALDHVIGFYNVSKEVEGVVKAGPGGGQPHQDQGACLPGLDGFLQAMSRLKGALDYFEMENPHSIELENVRALHEVGGDSLSREFGELIKKYSRPVPAVDILNAISEDKEGVATGGGSSSSGGVATTPQGRNEVGIEVAGHLGDSASIQHFPEDVQTNLIAMAEWLNLNDRAEFMNVYASVRGSVLKRSLDQLRDHHKTSSVKSLLRSASPNASRRYGASPGSGQVDASGGTPVGLSGVKKSSRLAGTINKRLLNVTSRLEAATGYSLPGGVSGGGAPGSAKRALGTPSIMAEEQVQGELEVEAFCLTVSGLQRLMAGERVLMVGIIPHAYQKRMFEMITRESLDAVIKDGEAITSRTKKAVANNDFLSIMTVFQVIRHLNSLQPSMDRTLDGSDATLRSKYKSMVDGFDYSGSMALDGFIENIRNDATTKEKMPKDGTVFQLTSNVILFLEQILDYVETASLVLTRDTTYNQTLLRFPRKISVSERGPALVGIYMKKVLIQLNQTLMNKSESYSDPFLRAVFRLNNNQYILRSLQRSGLLPVVSLAEPDCEENYNDMILEQKRIYSKSWSRVLHYIFSADAGDIPRMILEAPGKLGDKYCRIIKEKFAGFNKEIEEIATTQRSYSIPDVELRESLKRDNKEYICPKYQNFYDKYVNVPFTKNPEKYVKYSPAEVSSLIDSFFDAAA